MESENKSDSKPYKRHSLKRVSDSDKKVLNIKAIMMQRKSGENLAGNNRSRSVDADIKD